jgi:hypothetical protein
MARLVQIAAGQSAVELLGARTERQLHTFAISAL